MQEIYLEQGTPEWLEWRKGTELIDGPRITATAATACIGTSDYLTAHQLWMEFMGIREKQAVSFAMIHGHETEPLARAEYIKIVGEFYEPICIQSSQEPWIAASLDGSDLFRTRGLEIKCPMFEKTHLLAMQGIVHPPYFDQIQWQMLASDGQLQEIDYYSYCPKFGLAKPITVKPDLARQAALKLAAQQFRLAVLTGIPLAGEEFATASNHYVVVNRRAKLIAEQLEDAKNILKTMAKGKSLTAGGAQVIVSENAGRIDNDACIKALAEMAGITPEDLVIMKEKFRGKSSMVTTVKESAEADSVWEAYKATQKAMESTSFAVPLAEDENKPVMSSNW